MCSSPTMKFTKSKYTPIPFFLSFRLFTNDRRQTAKNISKKQAPRGSCHFLYTSTFQFISFVYYDIQSTYESHWEKTHKEMNHSESLLVTIKNGDIFNNMHSIKMNDKSSKYHAFFLLLSNYRSKKSVHISSLTHYQQKSQIFS